LDLYAQGDRGVKARLLYTFCSKILGENPPPEQPGNHPYELNGLRCRGLTFATDPEDGIEEVIVLKIRLSTRNGRRRLTLEADPQEGPHDLYDMMDECLKESFLCHAAVNVTQAEFRFRFAPRCGERPKPLTFSVTFPNSSNLTSLPEEQRLLAEKYLKRWGIDRG
jgi:hypothetical protein